MTGNCTVVLIRHAHTDMAGRFCGHSDPPLSAQGRAQLEDLQARLANINFTHIFSSDLRRAQQTAEAIAKPRHIPVHLLKSLRELAFGDWEGLNWDQVVARDPEYAQRWLHLYPSLTPPGGEVFDDFASRVGNAMEFIVRDAAGGCAAVVTHAGFIRTFLTKFVSAGVESVLDVACGYTSARELRFDDGRWALPIAQSPRQTARVRTGAHT